MEFIRVTFTKMPSEISKKHRCFFEDKVRRPFIKFLAYTNHFDGILTTAEIERAKTGYLPDYLDIHHIFPLSGIDSDDANSFTNLSVLHKNTHKAINKYIFEPQLDLLVNSPDYAKTSTWLPQFNPVDGDRILAYLNNDTRLPPDIRYGVRYLNSKYGFNDFACNPKKLLTPTPKDLEFIKNNLRERFSSSRN